MHISTVITSNNIKCNSSSSNCTLENVLVGTFLPPGSGLATPGVDYNPVEQKRSLKLSPKSCQSYNKSPNSLPSGSYGTKLGSTGFFRLCFKFDRFSEFSTFFDGFSTFSPNPDETSFRFRTPFRSCCPEQKSRISDVINRVEIKRSFVCDVIWKEKQDLLR